jgi:hypothetical protein
VVLCFKQLSYLYTTISKSISNEIRFSACFLERHSSAVMMMVMMMMIMMMMVVMMMI